MNKIPCKLRILAGSAGILLICLISLISVEYLGGADQEIIRTEKGTVQMASAGMIRNGFQQTGSEAPGLEVRKLKVLVFGLPLIFVAFCLEGMKRAKRKHTGEERP